MGDLGSEFHEQIHPQSRACVSKEKFSKAKGRAGQAVQVPCTGAGVPVETDVPPRVALILGTQMLPTGAGVYRGQGSVPAAGSPGWNRCAPQSRVPSGSHEIATRWKGLGGRPARGFRIRLDLTGTTHCLLTHTPLSSLPALLVFFLPPGSHPAASLEHLGPGPLSLGKHKHILELLFRHRPVAASLTVAAGEFSSGTFPQPSEQQAQALHIPTLPALILFSSKVYFFPKV